MKQVKMYFNPIIVLFLTLLIICPLVLVVNFNPIIVLFLTSNDIEINPDIEEFQSYYSLISNHHLQQII